MQLVWSKAVCASVALFPPKLFPESVHLFWLSIIKLFPNDVCPSINFSNKGMWWFWGFFSSLSFLTFKTCTTFCRSSANSDVCAEVTPGLYTNKRLPCHNRFQSAESQELGSIHLPVPEAPRSRFSLGLFHQRHSLSPLVSSW